MNLTPHFTLAELTASATGQRLGIDNTPPPEHLAKLTLTAEMLERVRALLQTPVIVTSGYRSMRLNVAVGGVTSSDHARGQARQCPTSASVCRTAAGAAGAALATI